MGVQRLAGGLWDAQRRTHISVAAELEMSLQQTKGREVQRLLVLR